MAIYVLAGFLFHINMILFSVGPKSHIVVQIPLNSRIILQQIVMKQVLRVIIPSYVWAIYSRYVWIASPHVPLMPCTASALSTQL